MTHELISDGLPWSDRATFCARLAEFVGAPRQPRPEDWRLFVPRRDLALAVIARLEPGAHDATLRGRVADPREDWSVRRVAALALRDRPCTLEPRALRELLAEAVADPSGATASLCDVLGLVRTAGQAEAARAVLDAAPVRRRVEALIALARSVAREPAVLDLRDGLYARWLVEDRARLEATRDAADSCAYLNDDVACATLDRASSRELLLEQWRALPPGDDDVDDQGLAQRVGALPEVAARPRDAAFARVARSLALPPRALLEHLGAGPLRAAIAARVAAAFVTLRTHGDDDARWRAAHGAQRALDALDALPGAHELAIDLLARHGHDAAFEAHHAACARLVAPLVGLLWSRDRAQTVDLALRAALRGGFTAVVGAVLDRVSGAPAPGDRALLEWALLRSHEQPYVAARAAAALARLGATGPAWAGVVDALIEGSDEASAVWAAIAAARAGREAGVARLVRLAQSTARGPTRTAAVTELAALDAARHVELFDHVVRSTGAGACDCCCGGPDAAAVRGLARAGAIDRLAHWVVRAPSPVLLDAFVDCVEGAATA